MTTTPIRLTFEDGCAVRFEVAGHPTMRLSTVEPPRMEFSMGSIVYRGVDDYTGAYTATPSDVVQVFDTLGKKMTDVFTVQPIPSNYGLITYNGSTITVS